MGKRGKHFRKKSITTYLFVLLIFGVAIGGLYFLDNVRITGFAIFNQGDQSEFDKGTYNNTEWNGSSIILSSGNVSGTYESKVFDASAGATWNNISWMRNIPFSASSASVFFDDFESGGLGEWTLTHTGSAEDWTASTTDPYQGTFHAQSNPKDAGDLSVIERTISTVGYSTINFTYYRKLVGLDTADWFRAKWYDGTTWTTLEEINSVTDSVYVYKEYSLPSQADNNSNFAIKFECTAGAVSEYCRVDNINITSPSNIYTNLTFQARSDSDNISWGSFTGPDGTSFTYYTNNNGENLNVSNNQYFQYEVYFTSPNPSMTPDLSNVSINYDIINTAPTITLVEPQNILYMTNESLDLNFTVTDSNNNFESCWYNLNSGSNISLSSCQNITFNVSEEGTYLLTIYANDTFGLESNDIVSFSVDLTGISLIIIQPMGTKTSRTGISLNYNVVGNNLTCWYNVKTSVGGDVVGNTTIANCSNSNFDVSSDGDYILNLYVNNTLGNLNYTNSSFSVDTSSSEPPPSGGSSGGGGGGGGSIILAKLLVGEISNLIADAGESKKINWNVKNTGTKFLNECEFTGDGEFSSWVSSFEPLKNLAAGEEYNFIFDLNIPEDINAGEYSLVALLSCKEINESSSFFVEVLEKRIGFELVKVERVEDDIVKIIYSLEELSGLDQDVELQFLLFDSNNEKAAEVKETKTLLSNSIQEFEIFIPIDSFLDGELNLLINLNSKTYSGFVQESIILGAPATGLLIFGDPNSRDNYLSVVFIVLFLVFAFFVIRRIFGHKKHLNLRKKVKVLKKSNKGKIILIKSRKRGRR